MSHLSGEYTYSFSRLDPSWCDSSQTGINSLVVGMTCTFSGVDSFDNETIVSRYVDSTTGFNPYITYEYLNDNVDTIANSLASGLNWFTSLTEQVSGSIDHPVPVTGFAPSGVEPVPPTNLEGTHII